MRRRIVVLVLVALALVGLTAARPTAASDGSEHIRRMTIDVELRADGTMRIVEEIVYDFGTTPRRGILRDLVVREAFDDDLFRVYEIRDIEVDTDPGTPDDLDVSTVEGVVLRLRIGDPDVTIVGEHRYVISYTVIGAPQSFDTHDELYWDVVGGSWVVPIDEVDVTLRTPDAIDEVLCVWGAGGSALQCDEARFDGREARFVQQGLRPYEGVTIAVAIPAGTLQPPAEPILREPPEERSAFGFDRSAPAGLAGGVALLGIGGIGIAAWRTGRDRRSVGSAIDMAFGTGEGDTRRGVGRLRPGPVEFVPPEGIRPGQVGVLLDERADLVDVTATIVDLAVRGWLQIVEVADEADGDEDAGASAGTDYELRRAESSGRGELRTYERALMNGLFASGPVVRLSDLRYRFTATMVEVMDGLYADQVASGWFRTRPDTVRQQWQLRGGAVVAVGILLTIVGAFLGWGAVGLAVVAVGVVALVLAGRMPSRTAVGTGTLTRVLGFRRLFDEGHEDVRSRFAEQRGIFSEYLPYAIVFGCAERWSTVFAGLATEELGTSGWYSSERTGNRFLDAYAASLAMQRFTTSAVGTLYASAPTPSSRGGSSGGSSWSSSRSAFSGGATSGGGGGGGGGGSW